MKVLIIGGTGLTGPYVVRSLVEIGHEVVVFHRGSAEPDLLPEVRHIHGDRNSIGDYASDFERFAPEVVVDMMSLAEKDTQAVMRAFKEIAGRIVGISSEDVYRAYGVLWSRETGPPQLVPLAEDAELRSVHFLEGPVREKVLAEKAYFSEPQLPATVLRYPMVYGPNDGGRIADDLRRMDDRRPAILIDEKFARWRWSRGYAENVAHAVVLAALNEAAAGRIYNVAEPDALSTAEWIGRLAEATGWRGKLIRLPGDQLPEHLRPPNNWDQDWVVDTTRIRDELGYAEPVSSTEALGRTVAWWRNARPDAIAEPFKPTTSLENYAAEDAVLAQLAK